MMSRIPKALPENLPLLPEGFIYRLELSRAATPRLLHKRPVHRWFAFPHSYSPELVEAILDAWDLPRGSAILDPFVGAGTTLRVAKERGYAALGTDLSLLAVLVSQVKVATYDREQLESVLSYLQQRWEQRKERREIPSVWAVSERLQRAFTPAEIAVLAGLREEILLFQEKKVRDFFLVALLSILSDFSRAVADGGWFRWIERPNQSEHIAPRLWKRVQEMLDDLKPGAQGLVPLVQDGGWEVQLLDARRLDALSPRRFDALITSPPYANRHDYSRVFQIELLTLGKREEEIFTLRYRSLRSHVEAKPPTDAQSMLVEYRPPPILTQYLDRLPQKLDKRVRRMMEGYFEDLFLVLHSARKILNPGAKTAWVVGNVRHAGVLFPVDEILAAIGEQVGYRHLESWVIRLRGNSAQQMGRYGRVPSRETVVMLQV